MDKPLVAASALAGELFAAARWVVLAGSVLTEARTAGSDLDIVACLPDDPALPYRRSLCWQAWRVELFVHDGVSLKHYLAKDLAGRRPALHRMLATGHVLGGDDADAARVVRAQCATALAEGPAPLQAPELDRLRYGVSDLLDDLTHSRDQAETTIIAATLWLRAAELALHAGRHWLGSGKWLLREMRDLSADLAGRWLAAHGDPVAVASFAGEVLDSVGGPLFDGYRATGERPATIGAGEEERVVRQPVG